MGNQPGKLQHHNQGGRPKKNVHWKSAERPSPPGRPILIPLSDQQPDVVNLSWERPKLDGGSPITGYTVEHRRMGSPHWVRATPTPVPLCEVSISGLEPGWRYQFRVFAENVVGRSEPSDLSDALTVTLQRNAICVPRFIDELQDLHAVEDERIEFRVRVLGQPPPEINWFKDGYEIFSSRRTKIVNDNDASVLVIHQVALTDEGEIKCTATNRAGHVITKARLLVQAPPKIRLPRAYEDGLIVEAGEVVRLKVGIAGQPLPTVIWLHEGDVVLPNERYEIENTDRNSLLKINNVQRVNRGEYGIRASNKLGEDHTSFLVTVTARPDPPGKVHLNMSFGKSATLSWMAPIDDGGCKIGNYIVEYFRVGWNVWLKAATTRSLSTTLHDLIEGSEYKFRVKAENPYGVSEPGEESDILFIPDPKRGITKPKSANKLIDDSSNKPLPPRRKTLSPSRPQQDAATETTGFSTVAPKPPKPQLLDNEDLHREMSYGTPDQVLNMEMRKSPSFSKESDAKTLHDTPKLKLKIEPAKQEVKFAQRSPTISSSKPSTPRMPQSVPSMKAKTPSPILQKAASPKALPSKPSPVQPVQPLPQPLPPLATPEDSVIPDMKRKSNSLSPVLTPAESRKSWKKDRKSPTPPEPIKNTPALQRSTEPVQLDVNQHVRRYSGHAIGPVVNAPSLAIAIATTLTTDEQTKANITNENKKKTASTITNPTIQVSAPTLPSATKSLTPPATPPTPQTPSSPRVLSTEKHDDVHTSNEFMLVVFDKNSKVKENDKQDSFELDLEEAIQAPPISISAPDIASLASASLSVPNFPMRRSVSSTELLFERAMARFYEAVELEEAEKARKLKISQDKITTPSNMRKRLGSMTEAERLSFEKRSELRRQSADVTQELKLAFKWTSREDISMRPVSRAGGQLKIHKQVSEESEELYSDYRDYQNQDPDSGALHQQDSYDVGSDYTESTASSDLDSIEKFKMELLARTRSPSPHELETYHPRNMAAGVFTPYRVPTPEQAALVLNRPVPLPSPDFVPKPILKRSSNENVEHQQQNGNISSPTSSTSADPLEKSPDLSKGLKSFFKRGDKRTATERNTEENQIISNPTEKENVAKIAAEMEAKRKQKEDDEIRRKEAERIMQEEAFAAVDHYSDLVSQVSSTRKYHTPIYLDRDELKKAAEKAEKEGIPTDSDIEISEQYRLRTSDNDLMPPISNRPRLSISERGQMIHVRESASKLAVTKQYDSAVTADSPSEDNTTSDTTTTVVDETSTTTTTTTTTTVEQPDARGRTRIVKVKRIIKKRVPSSTRSRDSSLSRPAESTSASTQQIVDDTPASASTPSNQRRTTSRTRATIGNSRSPDPLSRRQFPLYSNSTASATTADLFDDFQSSPSNMVKTKSAEQLSEEAHEKVRSALSYSTDLVLFLVACYVYLFKDARLVLPILALMIYRQLGEVFASYIPNWMKRKRN